MVFNTIKGHPDAKVAIGLLCSRERVALMLGAQSNRLGFLLQESVDKAIAPVVIPNQEALCQEVKHLSTDVDFDLRTLVPAPTNTPEDDGPYITFGLCYASAPETHESDVTIHRLCIQNKDTLSMWITHGARHIGAFFDKAEKRAAPPHFYSYWRGSRHRTRSWL